MMPVDNVNERKEYNIIDNYSLKLAIIFRELTKKCQINE